VSGPAVVAHGVPVHREVHGDAQSVERGRCELDRAAGAVGDPVHDRQPEPGRPAGAVAAAEVQLRHPSAGVLDQHDHLVRSGAHEDPGVGAVRGVREDAVQQRVIQLAEVAGTHRVLYRIDDQARTVTVLAIGHREDTYRT
jgi:hypothetical protein